MSNPSPTGVSENHRSVSEGPSPAQFAPYIPAGANVPELTFGPLVVGTLLGLVFGASSLYLVLKVGLTVSASIPVAVISITFFKLLSRFGLRETTILENNIVQTAGSAGESIAFGVGVTMPAIMILGFDLGLPTVALVSVLGGILGVLMMIPLRRALIVAQHGRLKFPEGTACAEVLKAGACAVSRAEAARAGGGHAKTVLKDGQGTDALTIFAGFGIGLAYKALMMLFRLWKDIPERIFGAPLRGGSVSAEISPELLGVGYIIGPKVASVMCAGGVLSYLVLIPAIKFFGENVVGAVSPGTVPISEMGPHDIRGAYILYIGAGAVAAGGIISVFRSLPTIWHGLREGLRDLWGGPAHSRDTVRTDRDFTMKTVVLGCIALLVAIVSSKPLHMNLLGALLILVFGFVFVTVSSRLTGEIGSSSNPISGMTVATLLLTCLIFLILNWTDSHYFVTALSVGGIVCIAASNGGTTSQDLKTGFLVGATPKSQQIAILIGTVTSALLLGPILLQLNDAATVYVPLSSQASFPASVAVPREALQLKEKIRGPQASLDPKEYYVWHNTNATLCPPGRYLVDEAGKPAYLVDPGINGLHNTRPDGTKVEKFDAPKATLISYIIKGILSRQLPWGLVLLGVMIALVLEMSLIPSLAFAVGVYLPLSSSTPIFIGGVVRWLVDQYLRKKHRGANLTETELAAESDKSPGVLMASGYIAGGAITGILIAFTAGLADPNTAGLRAKMASFNASVAAWSEKNPFYTGNYSDLLSLIPFSFLIVLLYLTGREIFASRSTVR
jgi:putative OPT family oligopeptide transporter